MRRPNIPLVVGLLLISLSHIVGECSVLPASMTELFTGLGLGLTLLSLLFLDKDRAAHIRAWKRGLFGR